MATKGEGKKTVRHFNTDEVQSIRNALMTRPRDLSLFDVGCHLGLRGGDLLNLRWEMVLNMFLDDIGDSIVLEEQKTRRTARFPISPPVRQALKRWWQISTFPTEGQVWPSRQGGGAMRIGHLHYLVNQWVKAAGLKGHFGSHSLRKTFGRAFLEREGTVQQLAHYFGHHNIETTRAYLGLDDEEVNAVACSVDLTTNKEPEKPTPKKKAAKITQGVFITNVATPEVPADTLPSPTGKNTVPPNSGGKNNVSERSGFHILSDWRNLPDIERLYVAGMIFQEMGTQLLERK